MAWVPQVRICVWNSNIFRFTEEICVAETWTNRLWGQKTTFASLLLYILWCNHETNSDCDVNYVYLIARKIRTITAFCLAAVKVLQDETGVPHTNTQRHCRWSIMKCWSSRKQTNNSATAVTMEILQPNSVAVTDFYGTVMCRCVSFKRHVYVEISVPMQEVVVVHSHWLICFCHRTSLLTPLRRRKVSGCRCIPTQRGWRWSRTSACRAERTPTSGYRPEPPCFSNSSEWMPS